MKNNLLRFMPLLVVLVLAVVMGTHSLGQDAPAVPTMPNAVPDTFFFQNGDTPAIFLGDSITEQKLYTTLIETYVLTRFPSMKITFRNAGWGGDTSWLSKRGEFEAGLKRDVLDLHPKAVTIDFGMNDARGGDANYSKYLEYTTRLVKDIKKTGAHVALFTSSPEERYEADAPAGSAYNRMLKKYADGVKIVADNEKVLFVDQYTPFVALIEAGRKAGVLSATSDPLAPRLTNDGVHPNWGGHLIMATILLQGMHAPAEVSSVTLDSAAHSIMASQGCSVEWLDSPAGTVRFKRTDDCLPWPIPVDSRIDMVMKIPGFDPVTALNRYGLKVTGLKETAYTLAIDEKDCGVYTSADLANGVNLGFARQGPIYDQGQELLKAVIAKNDAYFKRWRNVQLYELPDWLQTKELENMRSQQMGRLDDAITEAEKNIETLRQPSPHTYKLTPVPK